MRRDRRESEKARAKRTPSCDSMRRLPRGPRGRMTWAKAYMIGYLGYRRSPPGERSFVAIGKRIGSDLVSIVDDGRTRASDGLRLRGRRQEARDRRRGTGISGRGVYDSRPPLGTTRAPRARHDRAAPVRPFPLNQVMGAGRRRGRADGGLDRGLLVTPSITTPGAPKARDYRKRHDVTDISGRRGGISRPVKNLRFTRLHRERPGTVDVARGAPRR